MIRVSGQFYDGETSQPKRALMQFNDDGKVFLTVHADNDHLSHPSPSVYAFSDLRICSRVANIPRKLILPNGKVFISEQNDVIDHVNRTFKNDRLFAVVYKLENNWTFALSALFATLILIWAITEYGIPYLARITAYTIPLSLEKQAGRESMETLDQLLFEPSHLDNATKKRITIKFNSLTQQYLPEIKAHLFFRHSKQVGANAFTLPGAFIIVTDEMVRIAANDQQILSVLAHELGHVKQRHVMRMFLQNSLSTLFIAGILGDLQSISSFAITAPAYLLETRYSRAFEYEADLFALKLLQEQKIPNKQFVLILQRLQGRHQGNEKYNFLSTHPATRQRIAIIENFQDELNHR